jgi:putative CocE/NonD family hydrolase
MFLLGAFSQTAKSADVTHHTEWAKMRDGVLLASEVYQPKGHQGRLPVILTRSPYNADSSEFDLVLEKFASRGYVVVNQDCRGTNRSQGTLNPFKQEQNDGYDAVEWAASQSWSNGKVGLWGASYAGVTVMQAAAMHPPHLVAVAAMITGSDYHDNWTYTNGVFDLLFAQSWLSGWADIDAFRRQLVRSNTPTAQIQEQSKERAKRSLQHLPEWFKVAPLNNLDAFKDTAPFYYEWLAHPLYDRYWSRVDLEHRYSDIKVPVVFLGGWYDIFSVGTVKNFQGLRSSGGSPDAREHTRLVMAPACHGNCNETLKFSIDIKELMVLDPRWWDYWLKGIDTGITRDPVVKLFVMVPPQTGDQDGGFWTSATQYPLPNAKQVRFYLGSKGNANTRKGDGVLRSEPSATDMPDRFVYDPTDPVPTLGGNTCCSDQFKPGVFDQSEVELRQDILVYSSERVAKDLSIVGPVAVDFWAASTAVDTDFTAKLVAVRPDGVAYNILDRVINARQRRGSKLTPEPAVPGQPYHYRVDLGDTAVVLKSGFRLRLEISSSNFPHYGRNPNTGRAAAVEPELRQASQTILHDVRHPSFLEVAVADMRPDKF